jgi:hypothetical protein
MTQVSAQLQPSPQLCYGPSPQVYCGPDLVEFLEGQHIHRQVKCAHLVPEHDSM